MYVDEIMFVSDLEADATKYFLYLNCRHKNSKLKCEKENVQKNSLDVWQDQINL